MLNVIVTGGGTIAPIDEVRQLRNVSTGLFSARITEAFLDRGATVRHLHAPGAALPYLRSAHADLLAEPFDHEIERLQDVRRAFLAARERLTLIPLPTGTVAEYAEALKTQLTEAPIDVAVLAMAVADYEPRAEAGKITSDHDSLVIHATRTPKVIREVRAWAPNIYLVGFKLVVGATSDEAIQAARSTLAFSDADLVVANDLRPYQQGAHTLHLVRPNAPVETVGPVGDVAALFTDRIMAWAHASTRDRNANL